MTYFTDYEIRDGKIYVYREKGDSADPVEYELCDEIRVVKRRRLMYEKNRPIVVDVRIDNEPDAEPLVDIPRSALVKSPVEYFSNYGLNISNLNEYNVTLGEILQDTEQKIPLQREYNHLGYIEHKGEHYFAASSIYPETQYLCLKTGTETKSMGTFESWRNALLPYVEENSKLQLALAIAASAPVLKLLQMLNVMHDSMLFGYIGASSTAKTLSLSLGCSIFAKPTVSDGMIDTMIDTENYFFSQLSKKNGVPHFVDEATLENRMDFTKCIYQVSMQHERGRLNGDGTQKETRKWVSTVIFTGERSVLDMTNGNSGLVARMIEFNHIWTKDGKSADEIYKIINENYGTAWKPLIQSLFGLNKTELIELYDCNLKQLKNQVNASSGVGNRILAKFAVLLTTIDVLKDAWNMSFNKDEISDILISRYNEIVKGDVLLGVYEDLLTHIVENGNLFPSCCKSDIASVSSDKKHGIISEYNKRKCVWMLKDKFEKFVSSKPNVNLKMLKKGFKERKYIAYFDESYLRKHKIGSADVPCYCVYLDYGEPEENSEPVKKIVKKSPVLIKSKVHSLLAEGA